MPTLSDLLQKASEFRWLIAHVQPYDVDAGSPKDLYYSNKGFTTEPGDTPANTPYIPRVQADAGFSIDRNILGGRRLRGVVELNLGSLRLLSGSRDTEPVLDPVADLAWNGRLVELDLGGRDFGLSEFGRIFTGQSESVSLTKSELRISLRDPLASLDKPVQTRNFAGTGGLEGPSDMEGRPKPLALGRNRLVEPIPLGEIDLGDGTLLTFATGDNTDGVSKHLAVYSNGNGLTEVTSGAPSAGQWKDYPSSGVFQLGGSEAGTLITCDVDGALDSDDNFPSTAADIVRLVRDRVAPSLSFKSGTISGLNSKNSSTVGWWVPDGGRALDVVEAVINTVGGYVTANRLGEVVLGRVEAPSDTAVASFDETQIVEIRRLRTTGPLASAQVQHKRTWRQHRRSEVASDLSADRTSQLTGQWRTTPEKGGVSTNIYPDAEDEQFPANFDDAAAADTEAQRIADLHGVERRAYEVVVTGQALLRELGETVTITDDRFGLSQGKNFVIVGLRESAPFIATRMVLWG